jgi:hypothetical protein
VSQDVKRFASAHCLASRILLQIQQKIPDRRLTVAMRSAQARLGLPEYNAYMIGSRWSPERGWIGGCDEDGSSI